MTSAAAVDPRVSSIPGDHIVARATYALFGAYVWAVPLVRVGIVPLGPTFVQVADLVFAVTALLWAVAVMTKRLPWPPRALLAPCAALFAAAILSVTASEHLKTSLVKLIGLAYLIAVASVTWSLASVSRAAYRYVLAAFASAAVFTGVLGTASALLFYLGVRDPHVNIFLWNMGSVPVGNYPRVVVFFMNANMLCNYLLVGMGALAMLIPLVSPPARRWIFLAAVPIAVTSVFTLSTGLGGLALGGALGWIWWQASEKRVRLWREAPIALGALAIAGALVVVTVFLMVPKGTGDLRLGPVDLSFETSGRVAVWESAASRFAYHPLRGLGIGNPAAMTDHPRALNPVELLGTPQEKHGMTPFEAHNVWLNVAAQLGIPGILAFIWLNVAVVRAIWPRRGSVRALFQTRIAAFSCWVAAIGFHGLFGAFEDSRQLWYFFGIALAVTAAGEPDRGGAAPLDSPTDLAGNHGA